MAQQSGSSRAVVLSLYRTMLRWLNQPVVREARFLAGDLPPELLALGLTRQQLTSREGVRDAIVSTFRSRAALADPAERSKSVDLGFKGMLYLNGLTAVLERATERREQNRDRRGIQFKIGQVVRHKLFHYRGVVVGWDRRPTVDVSGWDGVSASGAEQPFYHVACDAHDVAHFLGGSDRESGGTGQRRLMYVAQENLLEENLLERRVHSDVIASAAKFYDTGTGRFVLEDHLAYQYPADVDEGASHQQPPHRKNLRLSSEHAKLIDAARRVERQVQLLGLKMHQDLQQQVGGRLEQFGEPVSGLVASLERMMAMAAGEGAAAEDGRPLDHHHQQQQRRHLSKQKRATAAGPQSKLHQVAGGYAALRALRDLFVLSEDLHASRAGSRDREGVLFGVGNVVKHGTLGYRGVVAGIERFPKVALPSDPEWLEPMHPHYKVIIDESDRVGSSAPPAGMVVLPQEVLEPTSAVVVSPLIPETFTHYDPLTGRYQPNLTTRFKYELEDGGSGPGDQQRRQEERVVERVFRVLLKLFSHVRRGRHGHGLKGDLLLMLRGAMRKEDADMAEALLWHVYLAHPSADLVDLMEDGVQLMLRAKYEDAIARFDAALRIDAAFAEAYNKRATAYFLSGQYDKAQAEVVKTLEREPAHFGALVGKGLICFEQGKKVHAIKAFRAALRVHPWSNNVGTTIHHTRKLLEDEENLAVEV